MEASPVLGCGRLVRAMTRCECSELPFDEIVGRIRGGRSLDAVQAETGAGLLCTACLPDLRSHLAAEGVSPGETGAGALGPAALDSLADRG